MGCPLRCIWCHNPGGISFEPRIMVNSELCIRCGTCRTDPAPIFRNIYSAAGSETFVEIRIPVVPGVNDDEDTLAEIDAYLAGTAGMTGRIERLRSRSMNAPVMRGRAFYELCAKKTIYIGDDELIVGERGPYPKAVSTYPELTCHTLDDLDALDTRKSNPYRVTEACRKVYREKVIPYWYKKTMGERIFEVLDDEWKQAYEAGIFTEFMEQRAPGHTTLDGKFYTKGLEGFKEDIRAALQALDGRHTDTVPGNGGDGETKRSLQDAGRREELEGMLIACDAVILFAERHADLAEAMAGEVKGEPAEEKRLREIAEVCRKVPREEIISRTGQGAYV